MAAPARPKGQRPLVGVKWQFLSPAATTTAVVPTPWTDEARRRIDYLERALASTHALEAEIGSMMSDGGQTRETEGAWGPMRTRALPSLVQPLNSRAPASLVAETPLQVGTHASGDVAVADLGGAAPRSLARRLPPSSSLTSAAAAVGAGAAAVAGCSGVGLDDDTSADAEVARLRYTET